MKTSTLGLPTSIVFRICDCRTSITDWRYNCISIIPRAPNSLSVCRSNGVVNHHGVETVLMCSVMVSPGTLGSEGIATPHLTQHHKLTFAQIKTHTLARCPPGLYGGLHKRSILSFPLTWRSSHITCHGQAIQIQGVCHRTGIDPCLNLLLWARA